MARAAFLTLALAAGCRTPDPAPPPAPPPQAPAAVHTAPPPPPREAPAELKELRSRIAGLLAQSEDFKRRAHEALDEERYETSKELHVESLRVAREAEEIRTREVGFVKAAAARLMVDLDHEELAVREAATRDLIGLGAETDLLRELGRDLAQEAARRLDLVIRKLEEKFNPRQWASGATASTEFGKPQWSAAQATGAPNTPQAGDCSTAWASRQPDDDSEWLILTFDAAVEPTLIRVHETYNAGAITKVQAKDASGAWRTIWEGAAAACETPRWFEVPVPKAAWTTREVKITLDSKAVPGWNEIDAVELVGYEPGKAPRR
jgi:hypothetical protein